MTGSKVLRYGIPIVKGEDWDSEEYRIQLPEILKSDDFGDEDYVKIELRDNVETPHIHGVKSEKKGTQMEGYYSIRDGTLKIPERWKELFDDPINNVGMEFYIRDQPSFRIYNVVDFALYRIPKHVEEGFELIQVKPVAIPAIWKHLDSDSGVVDVASHTSYPGQRFQIILFNADDPTIQKNMSAPGSEYVNAVRVIREENISLDNISRYSSEELTIRWNPSKYVSNEFYTIYQERVAEDFKLIIPKKGIFEVSASTDSGSKSTMWRYSGRSEQNQEKKTNDWLGNSLFENDNYISVLLAC